MSLERRRKETREFGQRHTDCISAQIPKSNEFDPLVLGSPMDAQPEERSTGNPRGETQYGGHLSIVQVLASFKAYKKLQKSLYHIDPSCLPMGGCLLNIGSTAQNWRHKGSPKPQRSPATQWSSLVMLYTKNMNSHEIYNPVWTPSTQSEYFKTPG